MAENTVTSGSEGNTTPTQRVSKIGRYSGILFAVMAALLILGSTTAYAASGFGFQNFNFHGFNFNTWFGNFNFQNFWKFIHNPINNHHQPPPFCNPSNYGYGCNCFPSNYGYGCTTTVSTTYTTTSYTTTRYTTTYRPTTTYTTTIRYHPPSTTYTTTIPFKFPHFPFPHGFGFS